MIIKNPQILNEILSKEDFEILKNHANDLFLNKQNYEEAFGRYTYGGTDILYKIHNNLTQKAKDFFESKTLKPSFCMISVYQGNNASLFKHKDDNACTYHFDICIFQNEPWDIWVESNGEAKSYKLNENDGLAMYGNDQEHWREDFPNKDTNIVCNAFFFFCEPDHWYFTEGPEHIKVIREKQTRDTNV